MSLLDHPDARAILADSVLTSEAVSACRDRLAEFLGRYLPHFRRAEQRHNAALVVRGLLSGLQRKTCEPIAVEAGVHRKPIQFLVGAGKWDDEAVMAEARRHVAEEIGDGRAVLVLDATTFPKSGAASCGVGRQWCGRLGKQENCQRGIFLAYAAGRGYAPLDRRLYLPKDWATDAARRAKCHVPEEVEWRACNPGATPRGSSATRVAAGGSRFHPEAPRPPAPPRPLIAVRASENAATTARGGSNSSPPCRTGSARSGRPTRVVPT